MTVPGGSLTAPPRMRTFQTIKQQLQQQRQQQQFVAAICKSSCCFGCFCCCCSFCFLKSIAEDLTRPGPRPGEFCLSCEPTNKLRRKLNPAICVMRGVSKWLG